MLSSFIGGHLLAYGRLAWKEVSFRVSKILNMERFLLLEFDKQIKTCNRVRHAIVSYPKCLIVCYAL